MTEPTKMTLNLTDTNPSITDEPALKLPPVQEFRHIVAGIHIGRMTPEPKVGEMGAVLSVGAEPGTVEEGIKLRHLHLPYGPEIDRDHLAVCGEWVVGQTRADRKVLIRSEGGRQRPGLVASIAIIYMGGRFTDVAGLTHQYMSDFRYRKIAWEIDDAENGELYRRLR